MVLHKFTAATVLLALSSTSANSEIDLVEFADELTSTLYGEGNDCTSSLGVSMAFSLVYPTSTGDSEAQMQQVLRYPPGNDNKNVLLWDDSAKAVDTAYDGVCQNQNEDECFLADPTVEIANSVWVDGNLTLNADYETLVGEYLQRTDFSAETAGDQVNAWIEANTNGLIDSVVPVGPLEYLLLAINSIYLKASWMNQFNEDFTSEDVFYNSPKRVSTETTSHFMHQVDNFPYSHDALPGYQMIQMPFAGGPEDSDGLSMIFVLPKSETDAVSTSKGVLQALPQLRRTQVALALPKYKFESTYSDTLMTSLKNMGMVAPFAGGLCISPATECDDFVDLVIQKTVIDVNEKGVEAAAVTLVAIAMSMPPPQAVPFVADHAFDFYIYDSSQDLILFEGRVASPKIPEGSTAILQAAHADENFWMDTFGMEMLPIETASGTVIFKYFWPNSICLRFDLSHSNPRMPPRIDSATTSEPFDPITVSDQITTDGPVIDTDADEEEEESVADSNENTETQVHESNPSSATVAPVAQMAALVGMVSLLLGL